MDTQWPRSTHQLMLYQTRPCVSILRGSSYPGHRCRLQERYGQSTSAAVPTNHTTFHPILSIQSMEADKYRIGLGIYPAHHPPSSINSGSNVKPFGHQSKPSADSDDALREVATARHSVSTASVPGGGMMSPVHKNLGLVSVSGRSDQGKKKMRDAFNWLFRRVERGRRHWAYQHQPPRESIWDIAGANIPSVLQPHSSSNYPCSTHSYRTATHSHQRQVREQPQL